MYLEIVNIVYGKNPFETKSMFKEQMIDALFQKKQ